MRKIILALSLIVIPTVNVLANVHHPQNSNISPLTVTNSQIENSIE
jgi:hypothetical protein